MKALDNRKGENICLLTGKRVFSPPRYIRFAAVPQMLSHKGDGERKKLFLLLGSTRVSPFIWGTVRVIWVSSRLTP